MIRVLIIAILFVLSLSACTKLEDEQVIEDTTEYPDQESWNARMFFTKDEMNRAILDAGYVAKYYERKTTELDSGVKVDFYDEFGVHKSILTSDRGKVFDDKEDMVAIGNVVVVSDNGRKLYTEELHWNNTDQKIVSEVDVLITTETDTLYGDSFISDPDLVDYEITNPRGSFDAKISTE